MRGIQQDMSVVMTNQNQQIDRVGDKMQRTDDKMRMVDSKMKKMLN